MAHFTSSCLIFVLLLLSCELLPIEGIRSLRESIDSPKDASIETMTKRGRNLEGYVETFRPTTPGHSPGVGHSVNN